ncbi:MAG: DMT family transporter, partial [Bacteroidota bacterium]
MRSKTRVELLLLGTVIVWAMNFTVVKFSLREMDPMSFNSFRFFLAVGAMYAILLRSGQKLTVRKGDWPRLIGLGLLGHLLYQLLFILGLNWTYAANGAVMLGTTPIWVAIVTRLVFRQPLRWSTWIGIWIAVAGVWLIMAGSETGLTLQAKTILGDLTVLLAAVVFGLFTFLSRSM